MSQLLSNKSYTGKKLPASIDDAIEKAVKEDNLNQYFLVVPTGKIKRELEREIIFRYYEANDKPVSELNVFTLQEFAKHCFDGLFDSGKYHLINEAYRLALFEEATENAKLNFFKGHKNKISYSLLEKLAELIKGLKEDGVTPETLEKNISQEMLYTDKARLQDIHSLYLAYNDIKGDKYLDETDILTMATDKLKELDEIDTIFPDTALIIFEGFSEFKQPELDFISTFADKHIPLLIRIDYDDYEGPLYTILESSIEQLIGNGFTEIESVENKENYSLINHLKKYLFGYTLNQNPGFSKIIKIIESPSRIEEVILIARLVKYLILEEKIKPSDICVALRQPKTYSPLFRETFYTHKIPANIMERYELANSQVVVGIIAALDLIVNEFMREDIIKFLKNPFITINTRENQQIDVDNIISVTNDLRITGGKFKGGIDGIIKYIENTNKLYKKRLELYENEPPEDFFEIVNARDMFQRTKKALEDFKIIRDFLEIKKTLSPHDFREFILKRIIRDLKMVQNIKAHLDFENLKNSAKSNIEKNIIIEETEKNIKALKAIYDVLDEMVFILEDRYGSKKFNFDNLVERFKTAISGKRYQITEKVGYGVTVTTIEQTRQIPFKVMILPGAVDGEFPTAYRPERFLGMELPESETRHILAERMQFYQFISNAPDLLESGEKQIYITYPKYTEEKELVRSPFVDALMKVTTLEQDNCIIDYTDIKSAMLSNEFKPEIKELIKTYPWLYSIASDIDVHAGYAREHLTSPNTAGSQVEKYYDNISIHIKQNILDYIKYIADGDNNNVIIDKDSLPDEIKQILEDKAKSPISVSHLETYAKCPYSYFIEKILKIKSPEELDLGMTPLEQGTLLHKIVFLFYTQLAKEIYDNDENARLNKTKQENLLPVVPVKLEPAYSDKYSVMLKDIASDTLNGVKFDSLLFEIDKNMIMGTSDKKGILDIWLNNELERRENGWKSTPVLFEFGFGSKTLNNIQTETIDLDGLKLNGKIDRVEKLDEVDEFIIADYKLSTSSTDKISLNSVKEGKSFQMPLYILAMNKIFKEQYGLEWSPAGSIYYYFKTKYDKSLNKNIDFKPLLVPLDSKAKEIVGLNPRGTNIKTNEDLFYVLNENLNAAKEIVEKIAEGHFEINPVSNACDYCKFKSICRFKEF